MSELPSTENIRCSCCKRTYDFQDTGWRWTGNTWEHKCPENDSQAGYFLAEQIPQDEAPPMSEPSRQDDESPYNLWPEGYVDTMTQMRNELAALRAQVEVLEVEKTTLMENHAARVWERDQARAQVAEQQQWRERAERVLRMFDMVVRNEWGNCHICRRQFTHAPECPIGQARTLLGEGGQ